MVQTFFDWDAPTEVVEPQLDEVSELRSVIAAKSRQESVEFSTNHHRTAEPKRAMQPVSRRPAPRRGREEHVGVALVSVLGKYGISVDDLLNEIERQKREASK